VGTRKEALEQGMKTYFSNKACIKCETFEKYTSNYGCKKCAIYSGLEKLNDSELMAKYRTKDKVKKRLNDWRKNNPEKVKNQRERTKEQRLQYYQLNKDSFRDRSYRNTYGISLETYQSMWNEQNGLCAICGKHESNFAKKLAVDHCHETGNVRLLLCNHCNTGLGLLKDKQTLENAIKYLEKFSCDFV
jgi:hypothetical protein